MRHRVRGRNARLRLADLVSVAEAARLLGYARRKAYLPAEMGALPGARRLGHSSLVVRPAVEQQLLTGTSNAWAASANGRPRDWAGVNATHRRYPTAEAETAGTACLYLLERRNPRACGGSGHVS